MVFPEIWLVFAKFQVFSFVLFDLFISTDLEEKRTFRFGFFSFLSGKMVGNLQVLLS
jgi:hypothetical protein